MYDIYKANSNIKRTIRIHKNKKTGNIYIKLEKARLIVAKLPTIHREAYLRIQENEMKSVVILFQIKIAVTIDSTVQTAIL